MSTFIPYSTRGKPSPSWFASLAISVSLLCAPLHAQAEERDYSRMSRSELESARRDNGVAAPIVVLSVGGASFLLGLPVLLVGLATSSVCSLGTSSTYDNCSDAGTTTAVVGGVMVAAGAGMAIGGSLWLGDRIGERKAITAEIKKRDDPGRSAPEVSLAYGLAPTPGGLGFALGGTF